MTVVERRIRLLLTSVVIGVLLGFGNHCFAKKVPGYIVNDANDTIKGVITLQKFNQITGDLIVNGYDFESLYNKVVFKAVGNKRAVVYQPGMIKGFGFDFDEVGYRYNQFVVSYSSLFTGDSKRTRFLYLVYDGAIKLYSDVLYVENPSVTQGDNRYVKYNSYFLQHDVLGLLAVAKNEQFKTVRDLLRHYNVEKGFLNEIPENTVFENVVQVLRLYDQWLVNARTPKVN